MQTEQEIRENLADAGCSNSEIESILGCFSAGNIKGAEKLIGASRKNKLDILHECQQCIDRLDYLSYQMKR